jgi:hypothetical protein
MRYVDRGAVPGTLGAQLEHLQATVSAETSAREEWHRFGRTDTFQELGQVLRDRFRNKCAYCEAARSLTIDHFWPKSPHPHNGRRGTPDRMYRWDNLLPACLDCQGFECKGAHMAWDTAGNPLLLNPCDPRHPTRLSRSRSVSSASRQAAANRSRGLLPRPRGAARRPEARGVAAAAITGPSSSRRT